MKKLLIIQLDDAYFLFETLLMLEKYRGSLKDFDLTVLTDKKSLSQIPESSRPLVNGITTDISTISNHHFDLSINLSLNESAWPLQSTVQASQKLGPELRGTQLIVPDVWSTYLLTLKTRAPFLTFHLQDIYKNILGIKRVPKPVSEKKSYQKIAMALCNTNFFPADEQEKLIHLINGQYPHLKIEDISETDAVADLSGVLYIGPANFEALKICELGANGIFLSSQFQGFNLLPSDEGHLLVSSNGKLIEAKNLMPFISAELSQHDMPETFQYSAYQIDEENLFGSYLRCLNQSDDAYPIYQSHVVLWNFLLNLFDTNLDIIKCTPGQIELLKSQHEVLIKLNRLYDYAMSSVDTIHQEAKSQNADNTKIQGHTKNLREMEEIVDKISQSNSFLRPILDFYRIRRGQNFGETLLEQSQHSFLMYSEEHHALKVILELFTVTLSKNEVSI